jgi:hypothetical protein
LCPNMYRTHNASMTVDRARVAASLCVLCALLALRCGGTVYKTGELVAAADGGAQLELTPTCVLAETYAREALVVRLLTDSCSIEPWVSLYAQAKGGDASYAYCDTLKARRRLSVARGDGTRVERGSGIAHASQARAPSHGSFWLPLRAFVCQERRGHM